MKRVALAGIGMLAVLYVGINIMLIGFVPELHRVTLTVRVVDGSGAPVPAAQVAWITRWNNGESPVAFATADRSGTAILLQTLQQQPRWACPLVGTFDFEHHLLIVRARGHESKTLSLREQLPHVSLRKPAAVIGVMLRAAA